MDYIQEAINWQFTSNLPAMLSNLPGMFNTKQ